jgi:hypothetical protein
MVTGDPICKKCGGYWANCHGKCGYNYQMVNFNELPIIFSNPPEVLPTVLMDDSLLQKIKFLEAEVEILKARVEILSSVHTEDCQILVGGLRCSCKG